MTRTIIIFFFLRSLSAACGFGSGIMLTLGNKKKIDLYVAFDVWIESHILGFAALFIVSPSVPYTHWF